MPVSHCVPVVGPVVPPGGDLEDPFLGDLLTDPGLQEIWAEGSAESRRLAAHFERLAVFWGEMVIPEDASPGDPGGLDEYEAETLAVALALRCTRAVAFHRINDAHRATTGLPQCFARLAAGEFPVEWFTRLLRRTRLLSATDLAAVDAQVAAWSLDVTVEQYRRKLSHALARIEAAREIPAQHTAEGRRRVDLLPVGEDGIGCLQVTGPIPEILDLAQRLDAAARAVQDTQRRALEAGEPLPLDPTGTVQAHGKPLSLARIRYELLTGAALDTDGVKVPGDRFRLTVTVPALTLLGVSEEPGTLDGTIPVPASMARELAGDCEVWYRVLTDPATGAFLPLTAKTYRPSAQMLEHLRLRHATCAVPGCTRASSWATECDHIQEYDHTNPARGGQTEIENLHLLCWMHHRLKTTGLLDPIRHSIPVTKPGVTQWEIRAGASVAVRDDTDLATPATIADLTAAWQAYQDHREQRALIIQHQRQRADRGSEPPAPHHDTPYDQPPPF
ncbi:HNH endonuclease signature motif containing protein [Brachybacterium muris]|uniref:HNH endonuclease signature motif containing protein n=3 Tax=Brachybacterium muris TaxID=219301 RepID=UPI001ED99A57|nr:HNH endonuclease signature motif containing protein [Brachybacterium muris]